MKRILSTIFILLICCLNFNLINVLSAETEGECGKDLTWSFNDGILTISGTGKMYDWTYSYPAPWESLMPSITSVVIEDGVTSIGSHSFYNGENIVNIKIGNSVTSIGGDAFAWCKKVENIIIPENVTKISEYAFQYCYELKTVSIGKNLTKINWSVFAHCPELTHIEVDANNENYCDVDGVLFDKEKTILISYPGGRAEKYYTVLSGVKAIERDAFAGCRNLEGIALLDGVTSIGVQAFSDCENLKYISLPGSVVDIGKLAFADSWKLEEISVDKNNANYSSDAGVLFDKNKMVLIKYPEGNPRTEYIVPNSVKVVEDSAFTDCDNLIKVKIGNSTEIIGDAFGACDSLCEITIPVSVKTIEKWAFHLCHELKNVYYEGNEEQWEMIDIGEHNDEFINATRHYKVNDFADNEGVGVITVILNGEKVLFDQEPIIKDGRTLVPIRAIFEALGASVEWNQETQTVIAKRADVEIELTIGMNIITVNGKSKTMDVSAQLVSGRTMVPARVIAEAFGCSVSWDNDTRTVFITE